MQASCYAIDSLKSANTTNQSFFWELIDQYNISSTYFNKEHLHQFIQSFI